MRTAKALAGTFTIGLTFGLVPGLLISRSAWGLLIALLVGAAVTAATWNRVRV